MYKNLSNIIVTPEEKGKIYVIYQAGESRYSNKGVDYMFAQFENEAGEEVELYAEAENLTWNEEKEILEDESATYDELKAEILEQAVEHGIPESDLVFWYDE